MQENLITNENFKSEWDQTILRGELKKKIKNICCMKNVMEGWQNKRNRKME